jgi:altronate hydrolase
MNVSKNALRINSNDNVAVALCSIAKNIKITIDSDKIISREDIPIKHKIALIDFKKDMPIYMYGVLVGKATQPIQKGGLLTTENVIHLTEKVIEKKGDSPWKAPDITKWKEKTFMGYHRKDGQVGTDNIWLFFPLVFCENRNIKTLKTIFEKEFDPPKKDPNQQLLSDLINGKEQHSSQSNNDDVKTKTPLDNIKVRFITHQGGCGGTRQDAKALARLLAGYVNNPNVAGATVLSLGCQHLEVKMFNEALGEINSGFEKPILMFDQQNSGTTEKFIGKIISDSYKAIKNANSIIRQPAPLSKLTIGLECGGSDGFSGITANPTLGRVSDLMAALGGKTILSEFPELCGVEQEIANRCKTDALANKFLSLMNRYEGTAKSVGSGFDMNPSPGNIKDGLITDAIKSAGAAKKSGNSTINDILDYTEYVKEDGVSLLCTPGNDVESTTAMAGSGANIILFTTGLGTPTGNPITPVIKVSSNTSLAEKMPDIIDFNCGSMITENHDIETLGDLLLEQIIKIASGTELTKATELKQHDFIPWKRGVSL